MDFKSASNRAALLATILCLAGTVAGDPPAPRAEVEVVEVWVEPPAPGPDTLCTLEVMLANRGERTASLFAFSVEVEGRSLEVYDDALFVAELPPREHRQLRLFNFRTAPDAAPDAPKGGKLVVRLEEARWMEVAAAGNAEEWVPRGQVEGLPSLFEVALSPPSRDGD